MTEHQPRADVAAILQNARVDIAALASTRDAALGATLPVLAASRAVIDHRGAPGASDRVQALRGTLDALVSIDPVSAVVVAAAVWLDRYGSAGAPDRLQDLQEAVDGLRAGTPRPTDAELQQFAADPTQWGEPEQVLTGSAAATAARADLDAAGFDGAAFDQRMGRPDLFTDDGPPCDTDPVAHEERLAYLEPDDGQDDDEPETSYGR